MRTYDGKLFRQKEHLERLFASAKTIGLRIPYSKKRLTDKIRRALRQSKKKEVYLRLGLIRADRGIKGKVLGTGRLQIIVTELKSYPASCYRRGVEAVTVVQRKPLSNAQPAQVKALNFLVGVMAKAEADEAFEALLLNPEGYLTEGSVSNVFIVKEHRLLTPPLHLGILPGITREVVMELAGDLGIATEEAVLTRHDLYAAKEAFLTNTSMEVMPVRMVDGRVIGNGGPGMITRRLREAFGKETRRS